MSQARRIPRQFVFSSYQNGTRVLYEESYNSLLTIPDTTEQMEFNISSATQIGHQLAVIGDEFNQAYSRKLEDTLFNLAKGTAISIFKGIKNFFGTLLNYRFTKRIIGCGSWISTLPFKCLCQKLMLGAVVVVLFWWTINHALQN
uniref:Uncharacterized protein n=1 Tax=Crocodylus porosus TaxID=8502 RepID=A0A7M4E504_CROPO